MIDQKNQNFERMTVNAANHARQQTYLRIFALVKIRDAKRRDEAKNVIFLGGTSICVFFRAKTKEADNTDQQITRGPASAVKFPLPGNTSQ